MQLKLALVASSFHRHLVVVAARTELSQNPQGRLHGAHAAGGHIGVDAATDAAADVYKRQGKVIHDRVGAGTRDSLRATALQTMGHSVTMVTSDQLSDSDKFNALLDLLSAQLNIHWPEKTSKQVFAEDKLRSEIFDDWIKLADEPSATERARRYAENKARRAPGHFLKRKKCPNGMGKRGKYTNVERKPSGHSREN